MKKIIIALTVLIAIVGLVLVRPNTNEKQNDSKPIESTSANPITSEPNTVIIKDFAFAPDKLVIKKGTKITWVNMDDARHDITPTSGAADFVESKLLARGESYEFTFATPGSYTYKCSPHPYMKGSIEVTE